MKTIVLVIFRLILAMVFAAGALWLAYEGKEGWGWCIFAAITLGGITVKESD